MDPTEPQPTTNKNKSKRKSKRGEWYSNGSIGIVLTVCSKSKDTIILYKGGNKSPQRETKYPQTQRKTQSSIKVERTRSARKHIASTAKTCSDDQKPNFGCPRLLQFLNQYCLDPSTHLDYHEQPCLVSNYGAAMQGMLWIMGDEISVMEYPNIRNEGGRGNYKAAHFG